MCAKNFCFCSFNFILLASFCLWRVFVLQKFLVKKRNCLDNLIYNTTDVYHPQPAYGKLFFTKVFYLHTPIFICVNLLWSSVNFFFVRNLLNPSYLWESLFIYYYLWESLLIYDYLWEFFNASFLLFKVSKPCEYHHLKRIIKTC